MTPARGTSPAGGGTRRPGPRRGPRRRAFTLTEVIVAGVIVALLASATAGVISTLSRAQRAAGARREAWARADAVASRLALDLTSTLRDADLTRVRLLIDDGGGEGTMSDEIRLRTRLARAMRSQALSGEGGEYTVQVRVSPAPGGGLEAWRRVNYSLAPNDDGGGVATRLAPGVELLSIDAHDGEQWLDAWDSDADGLPHAVRVLVRAHAEDGRTTATVRRVVAIDRVPLPSQLESSTTESGSTSGTNGGGTK